MPRKSPLAIALDRGDSYAAARLGSRGGQACTPAQQAVRRTNGRRGGRPCTYRLSATGELEHHQGDRWLVLEPPYSRAARQARHRLTS